MGSSSAAAGKSSGRIVGKGKRRDFFSCGLLIIYFFLRAVAVWQHCVKLFPATEFKDVDGATEILNKHVLTMVKLMRSSVCAEQSSDQMQLDT